MENPRKENASLKEARMQLTQYKLHALLDFSSINQGDFTPQVLMERFSHVLNEDLHINNILFYYYDEDRGWELLLNTLEDGESKPDVDPAKDLRGYRKSTIVSSTDTELLKGFDVVVPIFRDDVPRAYILLGDTNDATLGVSPIVKHLKFAETLSSICYLSLSNFQLIVKRLNQIELKHQMEMAGKLQRVLVVSPSRLPQVPGIEYGMFYRPYFEIGGDSVDVQRLSETKIGFCIADVSGKGIPAALMMASFNAHFRARITKGVSLEYLAAVLNDMVVELAEDGDKFITAFIARFDICTGVLEYVNAGHNPPVLCTNCSQELQFLNSNLVGLGMLDDLPYFEAKRLQIQEPTMLLCYTDGLVESRSGDVDVYSTKLIEEAVPFHRNPKHLVEAIAHNMEQEEADGSREVFDDVSILALHIDPNSK